MAPIIALGVFILGYILISLESKVRVSKSAFALSMGGILWIILGIHDSTLVSQEITPVSYDIFNVVVFLLAAMSLVEILVHYRVFDVIRGKIFSYHLSDKKQFILLTFLAFVFSAIIDNLTTTIVMTVIARQFFKGKNLLVAVVGVVIAANAGGAFSPIGDVTTIMLWLADKFSTYTIITSGFLPSLSLWVASTFLLVRQISESGDDAPEEIITNLTRSEKFVVGLVGFSFLLPIAARSVGLPPVLGILLGLGITWVVIDILKILYKERTHMTASIDNLIQKTDIASLKFFIGILLSVAALNALGVLEFFSHLLYGGGESIFRVVSGNVALGITSSFLDNIPLTAIAIDILHIQSAEIWVLLAICVGTGGSLLALGSAAGVVAMGMVKELTFGQYFKIGFLPALIGFLISICVWLLQYFLF
ncbi:MAG: sodium:proton antiporter NhaD [bacterium]|nr:sodium:proton antiporter NhaD [bacterium]